MGGLLEVGDLSNDMQRLRRLFDLFERKTQLLELLEQSERADGVKIFIGGESTLVPLDECSIVTAPYEVDGQVVEVGTSPSITWQKDKGLSSATQVKIEYNNTVSGTANWQTITAGTVGVAPA